MTNYATTLDKLPEIFDRHKTNENHKAKALLLTCIDFRFFDDVAAEIKKRNLCGDYDHVILAGAELGPVIDFGEEPKPHWRQFFLDHLRLSKRLHEIELLLVLGHEDCGAYKEFVGPIDPENEESEHKKYADKLEVVCPPNRRQKVFYDASVSDPYLFSTSSGVL